MSTMRVLCVGGGGGAGDIGGPGGGGGFLEVLAHPFSFAVGVYPIVVGAGGYSPFTGWGAGGNGGNSSFDSLIAYGGGGGGRVNGYNAPSGASGGGAGRGWNWGGWLYGGSAIYGGQGFNGGNSLSVYPTPTKSTAGGGGGAGEAGHTADASTDYAGLGGDGLSSTIYDDSVRWFGGGGSARELYSPGIVYPGGKGGGGASSDSPGGNYGGVATPNTGGGAGACYANYDGATGIVVLRYPTGLITATGGIVTYVGSETVRTFLASEDFEITGITPPTYGNQAFFKLRTNR